MPPSHALAPSTIAQGVSVCTLTGGHQTLSALPGNILRDRLINLRCIPNYERCASFQRYFSESPRIRHNVKAFMRFGWDFNSKSSKEGETAAAAAAAASATVVAVPGVGGIVPLPIDYFQILGVAPHIQPEGILLSYTERAAARVEDGYSLSTQQARLEILKGARDVVSDPVTRAEYIEDVETARMLGREDEALIVEVPVDKVPGALCLLQESDQSEVVIQVGTQLLEGRSQDLARGGGQFVRDVSLAVALAYMDQFYKAMAEKGGGGGGIVAPPPGTIARRCKLVESAKKLLQDAGLPPLAPQLQEEILTVAGQMLPQCVLDLLSLPLDEEHRGERQEGVEGVRAVLWQAEEEGTQSGAADGSQLVKQAFPLMTSAEQIEVFLSAPPSFQSDPTHLYFFGLALIAVGFNNRDLTQLRDASRQLAALESMRSLGAPGGDQFSASDLMRDRAMCALLLGQVEVSLKLLGLHKDPPSGDLEVARYVYSHSPGSQGVWWGGSEDGEGEKGEDREVMLLPGLCSYLTCWLQESVLPIFCDTEGGGEVRLGDYFDDPAVIRQLDDLDDPEASAVSERGQGVGEEMVKGVGRAGVAALNALRGAFRSHRVSQNPTDSDGSATAVLARNRSMREFQMRDAAVRGGGEDGGEDGGEAEGGGRGLYRGMEGEGHAEGGEAPQEARWSPMAVAGGKAGWEKVVGVGALVVGGGLLLGWLAFARNGGGGWKETDRGWYSGSGGKVAPGIGTGGKAETAESSVQRADLVHLARDVVASWQSAKAAAMGPLHAIQRLQEVLEGPMLDTWREKAENARENDFHFEFQFLDLKVGEVSLDPNGLSGEMEVVIRESGRLVDNSNLNRNDSYESTYTALYEIKSARGKWKIVDGTIMR